MMANQPITPPNVPEIFPALCLTAGLVIHRSVGLFRRLFGFEPYSPEGYRPPVTGGGLVVVD